MLLASSEKTIFDGGKVILVADLKILKYLQTRMKQIVEYFDCSTVEIWTENGCIDRFVVPEKEIAFIKKYPKAS